jgi:hypothetical protein
MLDMDLVLGRREPSEAKFSGLNGATLQQHAAAVQKGPVRWLPGDYQQAVAGAGSSCLANFRSPPVSFVRATRNRRNPAGLLFLRPAATKGIEPRFSPISRMGKTCQHKVAKPPSRKDGWVADFLNRRESRFIGICSCSKEFSVSASICVHLRAIPVSGLQSGKSNMRRSQTDATAQNRTGAVCGLGAGGLRFGPHVEESA